ncbi:MAG: hypothetical protein LBV47_05130 [Bacteroidales bacterium]|jgi:transcriptional regulator CtsR|nr:hypothetical protein [Bacteroidales bacterium]
MKERLLKFLTYLEIGQTKFEEKTGLSRGLINKIKGNISLDTLQKITDNYPELNENWLRTGEGEMIKQINQNNVNGDNIHGHNVSVGKTQADKLIDLLKTKDEQISKSQEQIDRLIGIIEKFGNL